MNDVLALTTEALPDLIFAMVNNTVALVPRVSLTNSGAEALTNLPVELATLV